MIYREISLKEQYPFLGENGADPTVRIYLCDNIAEMNRSDRKHPCMVVCPGGGYAMCSQREAEVVGVHFIPEGFNVFVIQYSGETFHFPKQMREVAAVLDLIYCNAEKWYCDVNRIAMMGFSAGGHLVAQYANQYDCSAVREVFPNSHPVQATVLCYPVITALPNLRNTDSIARVSGHEVITEEIIYAYSCEKMVTENTPPAFLWHTAEDTCVPVENSLLYASALSTYKVPFELHVYPYGPHGLATVDAQTNNLLSEKVSRAQEWLPAVKKWLQITL